MYWIVAIVVSVAVAGIGIYFWSEKKYKPPVWHD